MAGVTDLVLDCSAALALFLDDEQPPLADALLDALPELTLHVPALWPSEFANALLMAQRNRRLTPARAAQILAQAARLPLFFDAQTPSPALLVELASRHELTAYDAAYLELATRHDCAIATLDKALLRAADHAGVALFPAQPRKAREPRAAYRRRKSQ